MVEIMSLPIAPATIHLVTAYTNETVALAWDQYENGRLALDFRDMTTGEPIARATVNLPDEALTDDETCIKSYAENVGMVETLAARGLIERTGRFVGSGFVSIEVCRWRVQPPKDQP